MSSADIGGEEVLFRRIRPEYCRSEEDGNVRITSQAFADRRYRPSVNRALLCRDGPSSTRSHPDDGVASVVAQDVRDTDSVWQNDEQGNRVQRFFVDVESVPLPDNPAHAEIYVRPDCPTRSVFNKLCVRLARLARWELKPAAPS